jgi:parvulin-like peptidyl-prolyl isomerase
LIFRFLLISAFVFFDLSAGIIDGVAIVINKEPITMYEIDELMQKKGLTKKIAILTLINNKLKDSEIKRSRISVSNFKVNQRIELIAKSNRMEFGKFKQLVSAKGIEWNDFKEDIKKSMRDEIYFGVVLQSSYRELSEENKRAFYEKNRTSFQDDFENSQQNIRILYFKQKEEEIMRAHFEKLKSKANIRIIR